MPEASLMEQAGDLSRTVTVNLKKAHFLVLVSSTIETVMEFLPISHLKFCPLDKTAHLLEARSSLYNPGSAHLVFAVRFQ